MPTVTDRREIEELALAMLVDTVTSAVGSEAVQAVYVLTCEHRVAERASEAGAIPLYEKGSHGLNASICGAFASLDSDERVGVLLGDLPSLDADDLTTAITDGGDRAFVCPDHIDSGSTLAVPGPGEKLDPLFGYRSFTELTRHDFVAVGWTSHRLRRDVDVLGDLLDARQLGIGSETEVWLRQCYDDRM